MRRKLFSVVICMVSIVALWGCASTSFVKSSTLAPTVPLDSFKTLSVNVQAKMEDSEKEVHSFKEILIAEFKKKNKWEVVSNNQSQLELSATITNLNKVGGAARVLAGAFAGRASVDVEVVLKDSKGDIVSQFTVTGKSSGGTIFAGTTNQALEKAAEQIVAFIDKGKKD